MGSILRKSLSVLVASWPPVPGSDFPRFKAGMIEGPLWSPRPGPFFTLSCIWIQAVLDLLPIWEPLTGPREFRDVTGFGLGHMLHRGAGDGWKPMDGE